MCLLPISRLILLYGILCLAVPGHAAENHAESPDKRKILAQDFVARLKNKLGGGESAAATALDVAPGAAELTRIAVGSEMQFRPMADNIRLDYDIYAVKGENDFYLSLMDVVETLNFPIVIDQDSQTANGWFLREDWRFDLDLKAQRVMSRGQEFNLTPQDYELRDGEIFVAGRALGQWLGMEYEYDAAQQYVDIKSEYPLPIVAQIKRREFKGGGAQAAREAQLPRQEYERKWFDVGTADLSLRTNYNRRGDSGDTSLRKRGDVYLAGEALKHDAFAFIGLDDEEGLSSVTARLSRMSEDAELLGPLKARSYMVGDISPMNIPLLGNARQELGFRASSNPLSGISFQNTSISGYALPGWDVELYRGASLLDTLTVDNTGRYEFQNVQLYAGDNDFDVIFYGSQGEIRSERVNIPLNGRTLDTLANTYDFSVSALDSQFYNPYDTEDEDRDTLHAAGQYNYYVGDALGYSAFRSWQEDGERKFYLGSGLTMIKGGAVIDANLAIDDKAETAAQLGVRKNFGEWRTAFLGQVQSDEFDPNGGGNPTTLQINGSVQRDFKPPVGTNASFGLEGDYRQYADGSEGRAVGAALSQSFSRVSFSNGLRYDEISGGAAGESERLINEFTARARLTNDVLLRAGTTYLIRPESRLDRYFANLNYKPKNNLSFDLDLEHQPEENYSEAEIKANYRSERFRISPFLRYDSDRDIAAGINVSTSLINTPHEIFPTVTSDRVAGQGMVSAKVYLDANGNKKFDEGEQPLPDVIVESLTSRRRQVTDERGYALLTNLPVTYATDIHVDASSLPDPFMIPVNRGVSILSRPSQIFEMEFPVQFSGEIDGNVILVGNDGEDPGKFVEVQLFPADGGKEVVTAKAAQDGFYVVSAIAPGTYYMTVSGDNAKTLKSARPIPVRLHFSHEGDMLYAQDIKLIRGAQDIGFKILEAKTIPEGTAPAGSAFIRLPESGGAGLLNAMYRLRMKDIVGSVIAGLPHVTAQDPNGTEVTRYLVPGGLDEAWQRCQIVSVRNLPCAVELLPEGGNDIPPEALIETAAGD